MMSYQIEVPKEERITRAREALSRARALRRSRRRMGVDGIHQFVKDVDGDWLENWTETTDVEREHKTHPQKHSFVFELILHSPVFTFFCTSTLKNNTDKGKRKSKSGNRFIRDVINLDKN
ncbi:hypothetical protein [Nostoc sp. CCY0012]|uniref:hypothetical protein n=1 Tax=Nostoc sp. CCY0012 TaxID=1056123 RepID=UPI0039C5E996